MDSCIVGASFSFVPYLSTQMLTSPFHRQVSHGSPPILHDTGPSNPKLSNPSDIFLRGEEIQTVACQYYTYFIGREENGEVHASFSAR